MSKLWKWLTGSNKDEYGPSIGLPTTPIYNMDGHKAHILELCKKWPASGREPCVKIVDDIISILAKKYPEHVRYFHEQRHQLKTSHGSLPLLDSAITGLCVQNNIFFVTEPFLYDDREVLSKLQSQLSDTSRIEKAQRAILEMFAYIFQSLPTPTQSTMYVPTSALTKDYANVVLSICETARTALPETYQQFYKNVLTASKIPEDRKSTKELVFPDEYDGDPTDYLEETPLHRIFTAQYPFNFSKKALSEHGIIIAKPGHGKTQLLSNLVIKFLNDPAKPGIFCLDPAGDWFEKLRDRVDPSRLVVLDPETSPPPLNFFDFKHSTEAETLQSFFYLMSSLSGGLSDKQTNIAPYLLKMIRNVDGASLDTLREIVGDKAKGPAQSKFAAAIEKLDPIDRDFFHDQFYNTDMQVTKNAIGTKIYGAMASDAFRKMFSAKENSFDAHAAMREGKIVLVRGSELTLGEHGLPIFLQYVVARLFLAALARYRIPEKDRNQCYLLCDEASHIFNHQTTRILVECRKLGLSFIGATQLIEQIPREVKAAIYGATSIKIAGKVGATDASTLATEMRTSQEEILDLETFHWLVQQVDAKKPVHIHVPYGALEAMPMVSSPDSAYTRRDHRTTASPKDDPLTNTSSSLPPIIPPDDISTHGPGGWKK